MFHSPSIAMEGADELIKGARPLLDRAGSPAYCAVARCEDGEIVLGVCAFSSEKSARDQARGQRSMLGEVRSYVIERRVLSGRVRWTIWHGERDERLHQAFEEAPDSWV